MPECTSISKPLIIFGRSPFIDQVDVPALIQRYDTVGFNYFSQSFPVKYCFSLNYYIAPKFPEQTTVFTRHDCLAPSGTQRIIIAKGAVESFPAIVVEAMQVPCFGGSSESMLCQRLAFLYFGTSAGIDWAIRQGYTDLYLVGVDHVETDGHFEHFDGIEDHYVKIHQTRPMRPDQHREFKQFVYNCQPYANIHQTNPVVAKDWELPFYSVEKLLE